MGHKGTSRQLGLFQPGMVSTVREDGIPVYRVCLVREGRVACYNQQIRSAVDASMLLHSYLTHTSRTHSHNPLNLLSILFIGHIALKNN
jgi:hypothetical protein